MHLDTTEPIGFVSSTSVNTTPETAADKGILTESKVEQALTTILSRRHNRPRSITGPMAQMQDFIHAKRHSRLDCQHVDFLIRLRTGESIPVQVKSSKRRAHKFQKMCRRLRLIIAVIVVRVEDTLDAIIDQLVEEVNQTYKTIKHFTEQRIHMRRLKDNKRPTQRFRALAHCVCH